MTDAYDQQLALLDNYNRNRNKHALGKLVRAVCQWAHESDNT